MLCCVPNISDPWGGSPRPRKRKGSGSDPWQPFSDPWSVDGAKAGYVYVIQDVYTGMYKIGRTKDLDRRMKELGVGVSTNLIKAQFFNDCHAVEKRMHKEYADSRLPGTEYFRLSCPPWLG